MKIITLPVIFQKKEGTLFSLGPSTFGPVRAFYALPPALLWVKLLFGPGLAPFFWDLAIWVKLLFIPSFSTLFSESLILMKNFVFLSSRFAIEHLMLLIFA